MRDVILEIKNLFRLNGQTSVTKPGCCNLPTDVEGFDSLAEMALETARVLPHCDGAAIPLEDARILWQR